MGVSLLESSAIVLSPLDAFSVTRKRICLFHQDQSKFDGGERESVIVKLKRKGTFGPDFISDSHPSYDRTFC